MTTDELKNQLKILLKNNQEEGVVISLEGKWGIGKTVFWNNFAEHSWSTNEYAYISLYGKTSLESIKKQIIMRIYDRNKVTSLFKNPIVDKIIEKKYGFDISVIAEAFTKETFSNVTLCFDDFERLSPNLSIADVMGFISELKEQYRCKIVIINNSEQIKLQDELNKKIIHIYADSNKAFEKVKIQEIIQTNNQQIFDTYSEKWLN